MPTGKCGKTEDPDHLLADADESAEGDHAGKNPLQAALLNGAAEPEPDKPADDAPDEILPGPGAQHKDQIDPVTQGVLPDPVLQAEEHAEKDKASHKDCGMHDERGGTLANFFGYRQGRNLNSLPLLTPDAITRARDAMFLKRTACVQILGCAPSQRLRLARRSQL